MTDMDGPTKRLLLLSPPCCFPAETRALSSAKASQKARWVMKLSRLLLPPIPIHPHGSHHFFPISMHFVEQNTCLLGITENAMPQKQKTEEKRQRETNKPGKQGTTITAVLTSSAGFRMSFPVGLNSVSLRALVTLPLLLAMFATEVLLDASQVPQGARRVVMHT